jgi:hypothetical protein
VKVFYGAYQLVPAPFVEWITESDHDADTKIRTLLRTGIKLDGTFLITPSGSYEQMFIMQESLRTAFSIDAQEFRILAGPDNYTLPEDTPIVSGIYPLVKNVSIEPDVQFNRIDYSVDLEIESNSVSGALVTNFSDTWELSENPDGLFIDVTHSVSAKGINTLASGTNAIHHALAAVKPKLGLSNLPYYLPYYTEPNASGGETVNIYEVSVQRTESIDKLAGTYSVTEQFVIASGTDTYVHSRTATFEEDAASIARVTLNGTVTGMGRTNANLDGGIGYANALAGFNTIRSQFAVDASGIYDEYKLGSGTLYTNNPDSLSISKNQFVGTIQYTIVFTDDPADNLPSNIVETTSSIQRNEAIRLYASHGIPFRRLGPIIQDIKTPTEGQITVTANAKAENTGDSTLDVNRAIEYVQDEINRLRPNPVDFQTLRLESVSQSDSDKELTAQATVVYVFTVDLGAVNSASSDIALTTR